MARIGLQCKELTSSADDRELSALVVSSDVCKFCGSMDPDVGESTPVYECSLCLLSSHKRCRYL